MKNALHKFFLIFAILLLSVSGCKKKVTPPEPEPEKYDIFTCSISGVAFSSDSVGYTTNATQTFITAYKEGRAFFEINLNGKTAATYNLSPGFNDFIYLPTSSTFSSANTGYITITKYDTIANLISGNYTGLSAAGTGGNFTISNGVINNIRKK